MEDELSFTISEIMESCLSYDFMMGTYNESKFEGLALFAHFVEDNLTEEAYEKYVRQYYKALKEQFPREFEDDG